jgi:hypothetical protein
MNTVLQLGIMDHKENWWEKINVSLNVFLEEDFELHPLNYKKVEEVIREQEIVRITVFMSITV